MHVNGPCLLTVCSVVLFAVEGRSSAQERTPETVLAEVAAVGEPPFDPARKPEPGYLENYKREQHILYRKKAVLLGELCTAYPGDPRVPEWMNRRWTLLGWNQEPKHVAAEVLADIESVHVTGKDPQVMCHAVYWKSFYETHHRSGS